MSKRKLPDAGPSGVNSKLEEPEDFGSSTLNPHISKATKVKHVQESPKAPKSNHVDDTVWDTYFDFNLPFNVVGVDKIDVNLPINEFSADSSGTDLYLNGMSAPGGTSLFQTISDEYWNPYAGILDLDTSNQPPSHGHFWHNFPPLFAGENNDTPIVTNVSPSFFGRCAWQPGGHIPDEISFLDMLNSTGNGTSYIQTPAPIQFEALSRFAVLSQNGNLSKVSVENSTANDDKVLSNMASYEFIQTSGSESKPNLPLSTPTTPCPKPTQKLKPPLLSSKAIHLSEKKTVLSRPKIKYVYVEGIPPPEFSQEEQSRMSKANKKTWKKDWHQYHTDLTHLFE